MKIKHPRGSQRENGWGVAPVLVFTMEELLLTSNFCRPGEGRDPMSSRHRQVTKTWIPALDDDPIRDAGTTEFLEIPYLKMPPSFPRRRGALSARNVS